MAAACAENGDFPEAIRWSTEAVELGNRAVDEQLVKELKSYESGKPWREKQTPVDESEGEVTMEMIYAVMEKNVHNVKKLIEHVVPLIIKNCGKGQ